MSRSSWRELKKDSEDEGVKEEMRAKSEYIEKRIVILQGQLNKKGGW